MKTRKLLHRLSEFLDADARRNHVKHKHLRILLKELKKRQRHLEEKLEETRDEEKRQRIQREIDVIAEQRRKGLRLYREVRGR